MGARCCGPSSAMRNVTGGTDLSDGQLIQPLCLYNLDEAVQRGTSVVVLGPKSAGKTLLYLRLVYPEVDTSDILSILNETHTVHVDLFSYSDQTVLLWDISGDFLEQGIVDKICELQIAGIVYVMSMIDSASHQLARHRKELERLVSNPMAMTMKYLVIFNSFDAFQAGSFESYTTEKKLIRGLNLERFSNALGADRFEHTIANVKDGLEDEGLSAALKTFLLKLNQ